MPTAIGACRERMRLLARGDDGQQGLPNRALPMASRIALAALWVGLCLFLTGTLRAQEGVQPAASRNTDVGAQLYGAGLDRQGQPVVARRADGTVLRGADAACISCHRASGLGTFEGAIRVPPVAWRLLSRSASQISRDRSVPHVLGFHPQRPAYTVDTFARAVREGIGADGASLSWVMPRYQLDTATLEDLRQYLASLTPGAPFGAERGELVFAMVQDPAAESGQADAAAAVFQQAFADHNRQLGPTGQARDAATLDVDRRWRLVRWPLQGAAETWDQQLQAFAQRDQPLAMLGGVGRLDWSPIDQFATRTGVPLLWPSIPLPPRQPGASSLYFQRGVLLEAALIADDVRAARAGAACRIVQVRPENPLALAAANALRQAMGSDCSIEDRTWRKDLAADFGLQEGDFLVAWLVDADRVRWSDWKGTLPSRLYLSAEITGEEPALPPELRPLTRIATPWESPSRSRIAMNFPLGWLRSKNLPVTAMHVQTDAWLASEILKVSLKDMVDAYYPDYLLERMESVVGHRLANAHYPRLTLAPSQHFGSKGGLLLQPDATGAWNPAGSWQVPALP